MRCLLHPGNKISFFLFFKIFFLSFQEILLIFTIPFLCCFSGRWHPCCIEIFTREELHRRFMSHRHWQDHGREFSHLPCPQRRPRRDSPCRTPHQTRRPLTNPVRQPLPRRCCWKNHRQRRPSVPRQSAVL